MDWPAYVEQRPFLGDWYFERGGRGALYLMEDSRVVYEVPLDELSDSSLRNRVRHIAEKGALVNDRQLAYLIQALEYVFECDLGTSAQELRGPALV